VSAVEARAVGLGSLRKKRDLVKIECICFDFVTDISIKGMLIWYSIPEIMCSTRKHLPSRFDWFKVAPIQRILIGPFSPQQRFDWSRESATNQPKIK
jgi:hypothetical protein